MENPFEERFPDMRPIRSAPTLSRVNGCGFALYGRRDFDDETSTYVKTYCFSLIFIPVFAIRGYRVADAENGGWYMIGRVPLSSVARMWNWLLLSCIAIGVGVGMWVQHTNTPEYKAGKNLAEADRLAAAGEPTRAAVLYKEVALGSTGHAGTAVEKFRTLFDGTVDTVPVRDVAAISRVAAELRKRSGGVPTLFDRGLGRVKKETDGDPRGALMLLDVIAPFAPGPDKVLPTRQKVLERLVQREPDDVEAASQLALIYESQNQLARCEALLKPHRDRLGTTEGGRILGQILARRGKFEEAYALLEPYTRGRLEELGRVEQQFRAVIEQVQKEIINELEQGKAGDFPYERYKVAGKAEQGAMVRDYVDNRIKDDPRISSARARVAEEGRVVPVALDLGVVLLRRAQGKADPAAREAELKRAEQTFLAIRNQAGEDQAFRLFLGEVDYWLGKHKEGHKLFDDYLAAEGRRWEALLRVATILRAVGTESEARALAEEAFNKGKDDTARKAAAHMRAYTALDLDDQITWLARADQDNISIKAKLADARGHKALREGKEDEAAKHMREVIDLYGRIPANAATLNNAAISCFTLYGITLDRADFEKGVAMLDKALALDPRNSIIAFNAVFPIQQAAVRDVLGAAIDLKTLKSQAGFDLLPYLYRDARERDEMARRLKDQAGITKAAALLDRVLLLAPKKVTAYATLANLQVQTRDVKGLRALLRRVEKATPDVADVNRLSLDSYRGKDAARNLADLKVSVARAEEILKAARKGDRGVTFAVAATRLVGQRISLAAAGQPVEPDAVVALAEEAHAAAPSVATQATLEEALLFRASTALAGKEPEYRALRDRLKRSLGASYVIPVALWQPGKLREAALANPDVRRVIALRHESNKKFPHDFSPRDWAFYSGADRAALTWLTPVRKEDEMDRLSLELGQLISPLSSTNALKTCWALEAEGKQAEGLAILKEAAGRGVPLPVGK